MQFKCLQCGADNELEVQTSFFNCPFCKSTHLLDYEGITQAFLFQRQIKAEELKSYLGKNLKYFGFENDFSIIKSEEKLIPFWKKKNSRILFPANSNFSDQIPYPASCEIFFPQELEDHCLEIETRPAEKNLQLYFYPFFFVEVEYNGKRFQVFIEAVNGKIWVDQHPAAKNKILSRMLFFCLGIFFSFVFVNSLPLEQMISLIINTLLVFYFFLFFDPWTFFKKER